MLLAALGIGVFATYVRLTPAAQRVPPELRRVESTSPVKDPNPVIRRPAPHDGPSVDIQRQPELFVATIDGSNVKLVPSKSAPKGETPMVFVANETLKNLGIDQARALGVEVKDRIAQVDFNEALNSGFGSMEEANLVKALQMAMGQFKEIDGFQIRIDGQAVESLGHFEIDSPVPVIRPGKTEPESDASTTPSEDPASAPSS